MFMLYRTMKRCGRRLSILGFGCMRLPTKEDGTIDDRSAKRLIRHAIDSGVNYIDTAYPYHHGQSEPFVGQVLKDGYREKVNLATKLPTWLIKERKDMDKYLDEQLSRLQTDHVDFYLIHGLGKTSWDQMESLDIKGFLDGAIQDGRINYAGFSFHDDLNTFKRIVDSYDWTFCQIQYNYLDEAFQAGTLGLRYAAARGLGVIAMEPLRGGLLSKRIPGLDRIWSGQDRFRTPSELALRWVWNHPEVVTVLSGMNAPSQLEENLRTAEVAVPYALTEEDLVLVKRLKAFYRRRMRINCTGCSYCMPCPNDVDIPECFTLYNNAFAFDSEEGSRRAYNTFLAKSGGAALCKACSRCVTLCPQKLEIPAKLKEVEVFFIK